MLNNVVVLILLILAGVSALVRVRKWWIEGDVLKVETEIKMYEAQMAKMKIDKLNTLKIENKKTKPDSQSLESIIKKREEIFESFNKQERNLVKKIYVAISLSIVVNISMIIDSINNNGPVDKSYVLLVIVSFLETAYFLWYRFLMLGERKVALLRNFVYKIVESQLAIDESYTESTKNLTES